MTPDILSSVPDVAPLPVSCNTLDRLRADVGVRVARVRGEWEGLQRHDAHNGGYLVNECARVAVGALRAAAQGVSLAADGERWEALVSQLDELREIMEQMPAPDLAARAGWARELLAIAEDAVRLREEAQARDAYADIAARWATLDATHGDAATVARMQQAQEDIAWCLQEINAVRAARDAWQLRWLDAQWDGE